MSFKRIRRKVLIFVFFNSTRRGSSRIEICRHPNFRVESVVQDRRRGCNEIRCRVEQEALMFVVFFFQDELTGDGDGGQYHAVELTRGTRGFGFSIRGGREFQNMPLFVLQIAENGPASIDNRLRVSVGYFTFLHSGKMRHGWFNYNVCVCVFFILSAGGRSDNRDQRHQYQKHDAHRGDRDNTQRRADGTAARAPGLPDAVSGRCSLTSLRHEHLNEPTGRS